MKGSFSSGWANLWSSNNKTGVRGKRRVAHAIHLHAIPPKTQNPEAPPREPPWGTTCLCAHAFSHCQGEEGEGRPRATSPTTSATVIRALLWDVFCSFCCTPFVLPDRDPLALR